MPRNTEVVHKLSREMHIDKMVAYSGVSDN